MKQKLLIMTLTILILSFNRVKASAYDGVWVPWATYSEDEGQTWNNTTFSNDKYHGFLAGLNGTKTYMIKFNQSTSLTNAKDIKFNIKTKVNSVNSYDISLTESQYTCNISGTYHEYSFPSGNPDIEFEYNSFKCNAHNITGYADLNEHKVNITLMYFYNDNVGLQAPCYATSQSGSDIFSFTCPVVSTASTISGVALLIQTNMQSTLDLGVNYLYTIEKDSTQAIIDNQNENYNDFKNQNETYTDEINPNTNGANETIQYSQSEEQLLDSLDMNTSILDNININAGASAFIWDIVEGVRGMNPAIITLMTSILGLGIAKMILNR